MADLCSNDSQSPLTKVNSGQIIRRKAYAHAALKRPYSIRPHNGAEKLHESFLSAIRKIYRTGGYRNMDQWDAVNVERANID
jgi:hypothetical protein